MEMTFDIYQISEEYKKNFIPKKESLSNFEQWAMIKAYCQLYAQLGAWEVPAETLEETCVWDGNYLYNVEHQIDPDDEGNNPSSRLWLTENGILMLDVYADGTPDKLYRCD